MLNENIREIKQLIRQYLFNSSIVIDGIKIWGSPYSLEFHTWAFQLKSENAEVFWSQIEEDSDIIVTHGPPLNHGDEVNIQGKLKNVGDEALLKRVLQIKPKYHLFGHIHEASGQTEQDGVRFIVKLNIQTISTVVYQVKVTNFAINLLYSNCLKNKLFHDIIYIALLKIYQLIVNLSKLLLFIKKVNYHRDSLSIESIFNQNDYLLLINKQGLHYLMCESVDYE